MMLLQVVMLIAVVHFGTGGATTLDPSLHLCSKVTSGRFTDINLKSITYHNFGSVILFEGDFKYELTTLSVKSHKKMVMPAEYQQYDSFEPLADIFEDSRIVKPVKSIYMIRREETGLNVFLFTEQFLYAFSDKWISFNSKRMIYKKELPSGQPDYALVHDQTKDNAWGYVIHKDINQDTSNFVIYQLLFGTKSSLILQTPKTRDRDYHQYHLERTDNASQVKLVHSSRYDPEKPNSVQFEPRNRLFNSQPRGFLLGEWMYLFDGELGCVYLVKMGRGTDLYGLHWKGEQEVIKERVNVPYEKFFICSGYELAVDFYANRKENRCETSHRDVDGKPAEPISEHPGAAVPNGASTDSSGQSGQPKPISESSVKEQDASGDEDSPSLTIIIISVVVLIGILLLCAAFFIVRRIKQKSSNLDGKTKTTNTKKSKTPAKKNMKKTPKVRTPKSKAVTPTGSTTKVKSTLSSKIDSSKITSSQVDSSTSGIKSTLSGGSKSGDGSSSSGMTKSTVTSKSSVASKDLSSTIGSDDPKLKSKDASSSQVNSSTIWSSPGYKGIVNTNSSTVGGSGVTGGSKTKGSTPK